MRNLVLLLLSLIWIFITSMVLFSCEDDSSSKPDQLNKPPFQTTSYQVDPTSTDKDIREFIATHYAFLPSEKHLRNDKVFIFIPGTFGKPETYLKITEAAAEHGYYAFGLHYKNLKFISQYCSDPDDPACTERVLEEFLTGEDVSDDIVIDKAHSFTNRISKMLLHLHSNNPDEGWDRFLDDNDGVLWDKVHLAGHSQGAGHTMYIANERELARATFFSGPGSFKLVQGKFQPWISRTAKTPSDRLYGFSHKEDGLVKWPIVTANWVEFGMRSDSLQVVGIAEYGEARMLFSEMTIENQLSADPAHASTCVDRITPLDKNGNPLFYNVWNHLCFE